MFTEKDFEKSWSCPSDRELVLRSKLHYGWSVHTSNLFQKVEAMPPTEVEAILKVIRRAHRMDKLEIERVGRMLCRLENMTRNTLGNGRNSCSMCGIPFGFFASFVLCADCQKVWKKSGGWFYGKLPTMSEQCQRECVSLSSGSPNVMKATWEHRAPDIVRLQSYEPPEENHNDHAQYKDWTVNSSTPDLNSSPDDVNGEKEDDSDGERYLELKSFRERFHHLNQLDKNCLSVQNSQLSASCPSLTDLQEGASTQFKRRGALKRRKRSTVSFGKVVGATSRGIAY